MGRGFGQGDSYGQNLVRPVAILERGVGVANAFIASVIINRLSVISCPYSWLIKRERQLFHILGYAPPPLVNRPIFPNNCWRMNYGCLGCRCVQMLWDWGISGSTWMVNVCELCLQNGSFLGPSHLGVQNDGATTDRSWAHGLRSAVSHSCYFIAQSMLVTGFDHMFV